MQYVTVEDPPLVCFAGKKLFARGIHLLLTDGSGWTGALTEANVASSCTEDSYLKVSHLTRSRHAHQVTASSLYILIHKAYTFYSAHAEDKKKRLFSLEGWCDGQAKVHSFTSGSPLSVLHLELQVMIFVRSLREAAFKLYLMYLGSAPSSPPCHGQTKSTQATFYFQITTVTSVIDLLGNHFTDI